MVGCMVVAALLLLVQPILCCASLMLLLLQHLPFEGPEHLDGCIDPALHLPVLPDS